MFGGVKSVSLFVANSQVNKYSVFGQDLICFQLKFIWKVNIVYKCIYIQRGIDRQRASELDGYIGECVGVYVVVYKIIY